MNIIDEEVVEIQGIEWFKELSYEYKNGYEISPEGISPERNEFKQVILEERLRSALIKINHDIVNSFHSFGIELNGLGSGLIDLAKDEDDNVEAFYHTEYKLLGIMWHPEREKSFNELDKTLFKNHFKS